MTVRNRRSDSTNPDARVNFKLSDYSAEAFGASMLPGQLFLRMLCLERKRCERSGRRLVLMVLESPMLGSEETSGFRDILLALSRSIRDTDITGWYRDGSALGVIFTEIEEPSVADLLSERVRLALSDTLGIAQISEIRLSFHVFPDDCEREDPDRRAFSVLYPDLVSEMDGRRFPLAIKRSIDIAASLLLVLLLLPVLLVIAAAVRLTSRGPILFRQKRLGQFGKSFTFLKFRSMYTSSDQSLHEAYIKRFISDDAEFSDDGKGPKIYKLKSDPRVTKVGKFLRRTSLDELPQLFNVLSGQMSLVGPRPPLSYEFESYDTWHRRRLLAVKPGITGFWQVEGRSRVKFDDMVRMDLEYARSWSLWLDIKILLETPRAVFTGHGAY